MTTNAINFRKLKGNKNSAMQCYLTFEVWREKTLPDHSLLFVKSIPRIKFDDSRPDSLNAEITCKWEENDFSQSNLLE